MEAYGYLHGKMYTGGLLSFQTPSILSIPQTQLSKNKAYHLMTRNFCFSDNVVVTVK